MHPDIQVKEFTVKDEPAFRMRVRMWKCTHPNTLNSVEFIQDCMRDGEVDFTTTYNFLLTNEELKTLAQGLTNEN
jgi:hypothetical protein